MTRFLKSLLTLACLFADFAVAQDSPFGLGNSTPLVRSSVLPAEEAFALSPFIEAPNTVVLLWEIEDGYYLYRDSISLTKTKQPETIAIGELPAAIAHTDEYFGETMIYRDRLVHRIPLSAFDTSGPSVSFRLQYQGCAEDKYCYPMQSKGIVLLLPKAEL